MQPHALAGSGVPSLDEAIGGFYWGDNVVWELEPGAEIAPFERALLGAATYARFARVTLSRGPEELRAEHPALEVIDAREGTALAQPQALLAAEQLTAAELQELRALYDAMLVAARADDAHEQSQADAAFHAAIARAARNATLERQWSFLEPYSRTFVTVSRPGTDLVAVAEQHLPVLQALEARDGERAAAAMENHLMQAADLLRAHAGADVALR
jgi:hypothetical protein